MTDAVEIVSDLVKIPSVSPFGRNETERRERFERCREVLAYLEEFLQKQGAQTEQLVFEGGHDKWWYPVPNLYAELTIGDRKAAGHKFLCYMGHIDVVPVGEEKLWRRPPFSGQVDEGFVWGRGATDMKGSVGAWMSALEKLKAGKGDGVNLTIDLNNQQFTNLSNQLTQLKASIDLANNELEEKKEQLHQADIMLEYPAIEMKYIQFRNDAENYSKIVEQKKVEIDRLTEIRDKISQEIPKIKKEYKDEIYKLAPIVKMLNEADFVNEEHDYSFTPKKGKEYSINETINSIYTHFKNQNRVLEKRDIVNYLVSIINNFFIVFYGKPGVGKTSLVQEIANSLGANLNKISVNKGWTSPKDLLGYYNALTGHFIDAETGLRKFIKQADKNNPFECLYITLLDEANLSPLEYYWSNFLSVADDQIKKIKLQSDKAPDEITLFDGLKFIATINMDETTEALSPRIINRSCVFYLPNEYKIPSLDNYFQSDHYPISYQSLRKNFGYENILQNNHNAEKYGQDKLDAIYDLLSKNKSRSTISISARKQKMIRMYIDTMTKIGDNNNDLGYDNSDVLDFAIAQYILPEIRGDGEKYKELLKLLLDEISPYTFSTSILQKIVEEGQENYDNFNFFYI